jgi:hypothetical protein
LYIDEAGWIIFTRLFIFYMRTIILSILLAGSLTMHSQQNFTGTIFYKMVSADNSATSDMQVWFAKDKIKVIRQVVKVSEEINMDDEMMIIDFSKAVLYRVSDKTKTIREINLLGTGKRNDTGMMTQTTATSTVAGYKCRLSKSEVQKIGDEPLQEKEILIWYAKDLVYQIPPSLAELQMIPAFTNGYIALKTQMKLSAGNLKMQLNTTAVKVSPDPAGVPDSVFVLPVGYTTIKEE